MKKRAKKELLNKITAIFISVLIISMSFTISFSLNAQTTKADAQAGCCEITNTDQPCQETVYDSCKSGFHSGQACSQVAQCKPQTCIYPEGPCMAQKTAAECRAEGGTPDSNSIENIEICKKGCCGIAEGIIAEVMQKKECIALANSPAYKGLPYEFDPSIVRQDECFIKYDTTAKGCCVLGGGQCLYGIRSECSSQGGNFVPLNDPTKFCSDVTACAVTPHATCDCGKLPGTEFDIYWYDSQGNQEEMVGSLDKQGCKMIKGDDKNKGNCNYPQAICTKDKTEQVYCKSTTCTVKGTSQELIGEKSDSPEYKEEGYSKIRSGSTPLVREKSIDTTLLTGQSICYNFYSDLGADFLFNWTDDKSNYRSTGLQNQILHCRLGEIVIEGLGTDREKLCVEGGTGNLPGEVNANVKENRWENCTSCGSGAAIPIIGDVLGDMLGPFPPSGRVMAALGHYCDPKSCSDYGDCVYHEDLGGVWGMSTRIGSCDPKYPPGTVTACSQCGRGGDGLWNVCDESECASLGDCQFTPDSRWEKIAMGFLLSVVSTYMHKVSLIPAEFAICAGCTVVTLGTCGCNPFELVKDRWDRYMKGPFSVFGSILSFSDWGNKKPIEKAFSLLTLASGAVGAISTIKTFFKK